MPRQLRVTGITCRRAGPAVAAALLLLPAACQQPAPPPPRPVAAAPRPARAGPPRPPARPAAPLAWSFAVAADRCVATAAGAQATLTVTIRRNAAVELLLTLPAAARNAGRAAASLRFSGPSGSWSLPASGNAQHGVGAAAAADEVALGRVLILLGGGTLDVAPAAPGLPAVQLPPAGPSGQSWSDCAQSQLI